MTTMPKAMTRRTAGKLLLGAPAVAAVASGILGARTALAADDATAAGQAAGAAPPPADSALGKFLAKQEPGLDRDEKDQVRKDVASLEQALKTLRDFPLSNDVPPAGTCMPIRSRRGGKPPASGSRGAAGGRR